MLDPGAALSLTTVTGKGTVFTLRLPMRLGIVRALVTGIGDDMDARHIADHDPNLSDWSWVAQGSEPRMLKAIREVMKPGRRR